jgi:hypothetical protein
MLLLFHKSVSEEDIIPFSHKPSILPNGVGNTEGLNNIISHDVCIGHTPTWLRNLSSNLRNTCLFQVNYTATKRQLSWYKLGWFRVSQNHFRCGGR